MPVTTTVRVDGLRELGEAMRALGNDVAQRIAVSATAAAAQIIKKRARKNIEVNQSKNSTAIGKTGSLHDAVIAKKIPKSQTTLTSEHIVTIRGKSKRGRKSKTKQDIAPHAHFIEFGTVNMPAEPFLRPAFDTEKERAAEAMADKLRVRIARGK